MITTIILISLAAFFNAVMDSIGDDVQYNQSVFSRLPFQFWNKEQSWKYCKNIFRYHIDAWHISKSLMLICLCMAIAVGYNWQVQWYVKFLISGTVWNIVFNLFYSHIFKRKK